MDRHTDRTNISGESVEQGGLAMCNKVFFKQMLCSVPLLYANVMFHCDSFIFYIPFALIYVLKKMM